MTNTNWIDFESEISRVIQLIDADMKKFSADESTIVSHISISFFEEYFLEAVNKGLQKHEEDYCKNVTCLNMDSLEEKKNENDEKHIIEQLKHQITYKDMIKRLEKDLNKLIKALKVYLIEYIDELEVTELNYMKKLNPDHVLSFNYTNTFERKYEKDKAIKYDYIHGKARNSTLTISNNIVLGIDEYLPDDRVNKEVEFIAFKKFYQRIHKETGCIYREWVDEIRDTITESEEILRNKFPTQIPFEKFTTKHYLYIFGHSLDVTDRDVLRDLILNDNVFTTIYYYNRKVYGQQIANLVKVIGRDELIRRTGGNTKTIEFVDQQKSEKEDI